MVVSKAQAASFANDLKVYIALLVVFTVLVIALMIVYVVVKKY
jgi:hypothetical protein